MLNTLASVHSRRSYEFAIDTFIAWYCSEPRLTFNRAVVVRYRSHLEGRGLSAATINLHLSAIRRLADESAESGWLTPELAIRKRDPLKQPPSPSARNWRQRPLSFTTEHRRRFLKAGEAVSVADYERWRTSRELLPGVPPSSSQEWSVRKLDSYAIILLAMATVFQSPRWRFSGDFTRQEQQDLLRLARKVAEQRGHAGSARLLQFERIKGNRSVAAVYDVSFVDGGDTTVDRFAIKVYPEPSGAKEESARAQSVQGKEYFAKLGASYFEDFPRAVVYAYVGASEQAMSLASVFNKGLDEPVVKGAFEHFFRGIHRELSTPESPWPSGSEYVNALRNRLPPDFVLEAEEAELESGRLIVLPKDESRPPRRPKPIDLVKLPEEPRWGDHLALVEWSAMKGAYPDAKGLKPNLPLRLGDKILWLRVNQPVYEDLLSRLDGPDEGAARDGILLTFHSSLLRSLDEELLALSYPRSAIIAYEELRKSALNVRPLLRYRRHTDLHLDNIIYAAQKMTAIDLASIDSDAAFVCHARLETSIWYRLFYRLELSGEDAAGILKRLDSGDEVWRPRSATERLAIDLLLRIRDHSSTLLSEVGGDGDELVLTYATQALIHQRQALRDQNQCSDVWATYLTHWLNKVRSLGTLAPSRAPRTVATAALGHAAQSVSLDVNRELESVRDEVRTLSLTVERLAGRIASLQDVPSRERGDDPLSRDVEQIRAEVHSIQKRMATELPPAPAEATSTWDSRFGEELRPIRATPGWPFAKWAVLLGVALSCGVVSLWAASQWAR
jgi:hypothetical protein